MDRDEAITEIKAALRRRSGKTWSVTGGRGTAWGWITIQAPPSRRTEPYGYMSDEDCAELGKLLGLDKPCHNQGESIPASSQHYREYVDRAQGKTPSVIGQVYWD
jgi:hypothetical protein